MADQGGDVGRRAKQYLEDHRVVTLATSGPEGLWAAAVFYATDGWRLIFLSADHTRHSVNLAANPRVAATIQEDYRDWPDIKGIQLEGTVTKLSGQAKVVSIARFLIKYAFLKSATGPLKKALEKISWYCLTPERVYFIDNSRGFGHRDEVPLSAEDVVPIGGGKR